MMNIEEIVRYFHNEKVSLRQKEFLIQYLEKNAFMFCSKCSSRSKNQGWEILANLMKTEFPEARERTAEEWNMIWNRIVMTARKARKYVPYMMMPLTKRILNLIYSSDKESAFGICGRSDSGRTSFPGSTTRSTDEYSFYLEQSAQQNIPDTSKILEATATMWQGNLMMPGSSGEIQMSTMEKSWSKSSAQELCISPVGMKEINTQEIRGRTFEVPVVYEKYNIVQGIPLLPNIDLEEARRCLPSIVLEEALRCQCVSAVLSIAYSFETIDFINSLFIGNEKKLWKDGEGFGHSSGRRLSVASCIW